MKKIIALSLIMALAFSCSKVKNKAKDTLNKSGEAVGEMATEFSEGVSEGIDRTLDSQLIISDGLKAKGITTGKYYIENDSLGTKDNKLVIYIITKNDFKGALTFKVMDKKGMEFGRQQIQLDSKAGAAAYYDVVFDKRTNIEVKSTIAIE